MYPPCLRSVSASFLISGDSGDKEDTKRKQVSALYPLRNDSEFFRVVLRLGLEGANPGISIKPLVAIKKNLCIEALPFGHGIISKKAYWILSLAAKIAASG
jgi:hypothetical protein